MEAIRSLASRHLDEINRVKFGATRRFGEDYKVTNLDAGELLESVRQGWAHGVWLGDDDLAAVCYGYRFGGDVYLDFLGVNSQFEGRRYGIRLVDNLVALAAAREIERLTLITSGTAPWNRPYYEALGFHALRAKEPTPDYLKARLETQAKLFEGYPLLLPRIAMVRATG
jgi:hypothetical protein